MLPRPSCLLPCCRIRVKLHLRPASLVVRTSTAPAERQCTHRQIAQAGSNPTTARLHAFVLAQCCHHLRSALQRSAPHRHPGTAKQHCNSACNGRIDCVTAEVAASCDPARTTYTLSTRTRPATWISSGLPTPKRRMPAARRGMLHMGRPPHNTRNETPARLRNLSRTRTHRQRRPRAPAPSRCSRPASRAAAALTSTTTTAT